MTNKEFTKIVRAHIVYSSSKYGKQTARFAREYGMVRDCVINNEKGIVALWVGNDFGLRAAAMTGQSNEWYHVNVRDALKAIFEGTSLESEFLTRTDEVPDYAEDTRSPEYDCVRKIPEDSPITFSDYVVKSHPLEPAEIQNFDIRPLFPYQSIVKRKSDALVYNPTTYRWTTINEKTAARYLNTEEREWNLKVVIDMIKDFPTKIEQWSTGVTIYRFGTDFAFAEHANGKVAFFDGVNVFAAATKEDLITQERFAYHGEIDVFVAKRDGLEHVRTGLYTYKDSSIYDVLVQALVKTNPIPLQSKIDDAGAYIEGTIDGIDVSIYENTIVYEINAQ